MAHLEKIKSSDDIYDVLIQTLIKELEPEKPVKKLELSEVSVLSEI